MRKLLSDKIAVGAAIFGMVLMALTITFRVNPAEGSVVPHFLTGTPWGRPILAVLLVTCMPVWIAVLFAGEFLHLAGYPGWTMACAAMMAIQGALFYGIGKVVSVVVRRRWPPQQPKP